MNRLFVFSLSLGLLVCVGVRAEIGILDQVPTATLLLPYFEADLNANGDHTTRFTVQNVSDSAVVAHVSFWTDAGIPTLGFNLQLAPHQMQDVNLKDIFLGATLFDPPINFAPLAPALLAAHTGMADPTTGKCKSISTGWNFPVGYVLINAVHAATVLLPSEAGFFGQGGTGAASNANVLWGDFWILDEDNNFEFGEALVSIEASSTHPAVSTPGQFTFFGRFVGFDGSDNREPLPTQWSADFTDFGGNGDTVLLYWRDSMTITAPLICGTAPPWFPLSQEQLVVRDPSGLDVTPSDPIRPLPKECGLIQVGTIHLPVPVSSGSLTLDLGLPGSALNPSSQAFIMVVKTDQGLFRTGYRATVLASPITP